ncbi:MAG: hypothetical protein AAF281_12080, partial [Pseudomonadota bacterium]
SYWFQSQMQARSDVMARSSAYMITNIARISLILGKAKVLSRLYDEYKRDEFARFMSTVTEWDNEMYMECLP